MKNFRRTFFFNATRVLLLSSAIGGAGLIASACGGSDSSSNGSAAQHAALIRQGQQIFRHDTFSDEVQWTDTLRMHEVISAAEDLTTALAAGLKVDAGALPAAGVAGIKNSSIDWA